MRHPLFRKVDCLRIPVPDLDEGLAFYCDRLGLQMNWRTPTMGGLRLPESDVELVIHTEPEGMEVDLLVDSAGDAAHDIERAGGRVVVPPFDIQIGKCVVVEDPWGNRLVLLDMSKGELLTNEDGNVIGTRRAE